MTQQECQIILTDDDIDDRTFLLEALHRNQFNGHCLQAENGQALLHLLKYTAEEAANILPDLIVLDLNMPILNGYEVLKQLKDDRSLHTIPVVVLTSSCRPQDETWCQDAGCFKFYRKPFSISGYDSIATDILSILQTLHTSSKNIQQAGTASTG